MDGWCAKEEEEKEVGESEEGEQQLNYLKSERTPSVCLSLLLDERPSQHIIMNSCTSSSHTWPGRQATTSSVIQSP